MPPESRRWYRIENKAGDIATVYLYDEIGMWGITAADFVQELKDVTAGTLELHVNSPGGSIFDGFAILNALRQHPARVVAIVDGLAASAASYIAVGAGAEVVMSRNSELMIHNAWGAAVGDAAEMAKMAEELDHFSDNIASIYADKAGGTVADWRAVMAAETWYSAEEAVTAGLADRVDERTEPKPKAEARRLVFNYAGRAAAPPPPLPTEGGPVVRDETLNALRQRLGVAATADEATILAALDEVLEEIAEPPAGELPPDVQARLARADELEAQVVNAQRDTALTKALREGRITPAERAGWETRWGVEPAATMAALESLPAGRVPIEPIGTDVDRDPGPEDLLFDRLFSGAKQ